METPVTQFRSTILVLALGVLGAVSSVSALLVTDSTPETYAQLIATDLPVLIVVAAMGAGVGMLLALLWLGLLHHFAAPAPRG
jgi:hypothetical protein